MKAVTRITALASVALAMCLSAPAASAHVTANPREATAGGFGKLDFRVPNEQDVPTIGLSVKFPEGITSVSVQPVPGWEFEVRTEELDEPIDAGHGEQATEQVSEVVWTGGRIGPGEFQEFPVSFRLPADGELGDTVFFPAIQTYQGGEEVAWIERPASEQDDAELERPAPAVTLLPEGDGHGGGGTSDADGEEGEHGGEEDAASGDRGDAVTDGDLGDELDPVRGMAIVAIVIGLVGLVLALLAFRRAGRR